MKRTHGDLAPVWALRVCHTIKTDIHHARTWREAARHFFPWCRVCDWCKHKQELLRVIAISEDLRWAKLSLLAAYNPSNNPTEQKVHSHFTYFRKIVDKQVELPKPCHRARM